MNKNGVRKMLFLRNAMLHKKRCQRQIKEKTREASHVLQRAHLYPNSPARSFTILLVFAFPLSLNIFGQVYITEQSSKTLHQSWFLSLQLELFLKILRVAFNFICSIGMNLVAGIDLLSLTVIHVAKHSTCPLAQILLLKFLYLTKS